VAVDVDAHFAGAEPAVRRAFDRLVELVGSDPAVAVVAQKTRIVFAAPMRFMAVQVRRDRLTGHVLHDRAVPHAVVAEIVADAYGSGLFMHRLSIGDADELDAGFAAFIREAAARVGRRERLSGRAANRRSGD
jgi:hypothetical protein